MKKIKKGDEVIVISGRDKGRRGIILSLTSQRVVIEGVNLVKRHTKGNQNKKTSSGIIEKEASIHISNIALYNISMKKSSKVGIKLEQNKRMRYFKINGESVET